MIRFSLTSIYREVPDDVFGTIQATFIQSDAHYSDASNANSPLVGGIVVVEGTATDEGFSLIEAGDGGDWYINWDEPNPRPPDEVPSMSAYGHWRAFLARHGYSQQEISEIMGGATPGGRTRAEITKSIEDWVRNDE